MPTVLVVDDSKVDQRLVEAILGRIPDLTVASAENGRFALDWLERNTPDAVLTDMLMPVMGGIELIAVIRRDHPTVPIIAMTAHGSEETAAEALRKGATSYIPKRHLSRDLPETIEHVLAVAGARAEESQAVQWLTRTQLEFVVENNPVRIDALIRFISREVARVGLFDDTEIMRIGIALSEALSNAINHGNLGVGSELRETDMNAYRALLAERRRASPFRERKVYVSTTVSRARAEFVVRDEGAGFDPAGVADPTDGECLEKMSGRGMLLIRTFMDEVRHNASGNEITMVRTRDANSQRGP